MTGNAAKLELMFELESDRFLNLNIQTEFKTEAGAVKGEYTKNFASPYSQIKKNFQKRIFHAYLFTYDDGLFQRYR